MARTVPVAVGQVDRRRHHRRAVGGGHLGDQAKVQERQLAGVGALGDLQEVAGCCLCVRVLCDVCVFVIVHCMLHVRIRMLYHKTGLV